MDRERAVPVFREVKVSRKEARANVYLKAHEY